MCMYVCVYVLMLQRFRFGALIAAAQNDMIDCPYVSHALTITSTVIRYCNDPTIVNGCGTRALISEDIPY